MIRMWLAGLGFVAIAQSGACSESEPRMQPEREPSVRPERNEQAHKAPLLADATPRTFVGVITAANAVDTASKAPRLRFAVPPDDTRRVEPGTVVTAVIETIPTPILATVRQRSPALDPASGMFIVEAELGPDAVGTELRPGLAASITLAPNGS